MQSDLIFRREKKQSPSNTRFVYILCIVVCTVVQVIEEIWLVRLNTDSTRIVARALNAICSRTACTGLAVQCVLFFVLSLNRTTAVAVSAAAAYAAPAVIKQWVFIRTCFLSIICLPFQYFIMPNACSVLTISYELIAISWNSNKNQFISKM